MVFVSFFREFTGSKIDFDIWLAVFSEFRSVRSVTVVDLAEKSPGWNGLFIIITIIVIVVLPSSFLFLLLSSLLLLILSFFFPCTGLTTF